jgi:hypothetical protein
MLFFSKVFFLGKLKVSLGFLALQYLSELSPLHSRVSRRLYSKVSLKPAHFVKYE